MKGNLCLFVCKFLIALLFEFQRQYFISARSFAPGSTSCNLMWSVLIKERSFFSLSFLLELQSNKWCMALMGCEHQGVPGCNGVHGAGGEGSPIALGQLGQRQRSTKQSHCHEQTPLVGLPGVLRSPSCSYSGKQPKCFCLS